MAMRYLGMREEGDIVRAVLRGGMGSVAELFVAQMQDWLSLGSEARVNTPGVPSGNWTWRLLPGQAAPALAKEIREMTGLYGRLPPRPAEKETA